MIDKGIVAVTTLGTNGQRYYPLHVTLYTPAARLAQGTADPDFHSKLEIVLALIKRAQAAGIPFQNVMSDCFYGDPRELVKTLTESGLPYIPPTAEALAAAGPRRRSRTPSRMPPAFCLTRCWRRAFSSQAPPRALAQLLEAVNQGCGLNLYFPV